MSERCRKMQITEGRRVVGDHRLAPEVLPCELEAGHAGDHGYMACRGWVSWPEPTFGETLADAVKAYENITRATSWPSPAEAAGGVE